MLHRWTLLFILAVFGLHANAYADNRIDCRSSNYRYSYCSADTYNSVRLVRQLSGSSCDFGRSWGYDRRGVWVDNGCAATFEYGRGRGGRNDAGKVVAGVAAVAILGAILSANKSDNDRRDRDWNGAHVPNWAVGSFSGYDPRARYDIDIHIDSNGAIDGYAGRDHFDGQFDGDRVYLDNRSYSVSQNGNGFRLVADDDRRDVIDFSRRR